MKDLMAKKDINISIHDFKGDDLNTTRLLD